jgi:uncharacterized protein YbjT (DUF2867 family)
MTKPKVCITSVDGFTGYEIAKLLATEPGFKDKIQCICATAEDESEAIDLKDKGVTICKAKSSSDYAGIFEKADTVVLIPPSRKDKAEHAKNLINAASEAKVKNCIVISMAATDMADLKSHHLCEFQKIEHLVKQANFEHWLILRANFYAQNLLLYKEQIKKGILPIPIGDGKFAPSDLVDVAEATTLLLSDPDKMKEYSGQLLTLTGPTAMSGQQMAQHMSKIVGKEIKFEDISNNEASKILSHIEMLDESEKLLLLEFYDLVKQHRANFVTAHVFKALVGRNPSPLDDFIQRHKAELK